MTTAQLERGPDELRRRWRRAWVVIAVLAVLVVAWVVASRVSLRQVDLTWTDRPRCTGTTLFDGPDPWGQEEDAPTATVVLAPTMRCDLSVQLTNDSWVPVSLGDLSVPFAGPDSRAPVRLVSADGGAPRAAGRDSSEVDARVDLAGWLAPRSSETVTLRFEQRPDTCSAAGRYTLEQLPSVRASALGLGADRHAEESLGFRIEDALECSDG